LPGAASHDIVEARVVEKGGCVITFFRHHRQRGPVQALPVFLQG